MNFSFSKNKTTVSPKYLNSHDKFKDYMERFRFKYESEGAGKKTTLRLK